MISVQRNYVCVLYLMTITVCNTQWDSSYLNVLCHLNCSNVHNDLEVSSEDICIEKCADTTADLHEAANYERPMLASYMYEPPVLHCRTENHLSFAWKPWELPTQISIVYVLGLSNRQKSWISSCMTESYNCVFENLEEGTEYQVQIWAVQKGTTSVWGPVFSSWFSTLCVEFHPLSVSNITVEKLELINNKFQATVRWMPNQIDMVCNYELVYFGYNDANYVQMEFREFAKPFEVHINDLTFGNMYNLMIMSKSSDWEKESESTTLHFNTPTCLEAYNNLDKCAPPQPKNLSASEHVVRIILKGDKPVAYYDVTVAWTPPQLFPDYYIVVLQSLLPTSEKIRLNITVSGNESTAVFKNIDVGLHYLVTVAAYSTGGSSDVAILQRQITHSHFTTSSKYTWVLTIIGLVIFCLLTLAAISFFVYHRRTKRKRHIRRCKYFEELEENIPKNIDCLTSTSLVLEDSHKNNDNWELNAERLLLQRVLGEGAFGLVRRAWLRDEKGNATTEVAVKMLKDAASVEQIRHFLHEIEIMKTVGTHPHLVSLIGCCTRPQSGRNCGTLLVVEFCALGDLQNYLRGIWDRITSSKLENVQYADLVSSTSSEGSTNLIINKLYDLQSTAADDSSLKPSDLLSFARQIAVGMEFLSSMKVLHRDLAARNVLVCADKTVKVADFGLSRDVYRDNMYRKLGNGKLPIRWMALESLTHQIYTSQSDVWSFGILLWEIVTLGGNPYPSVPTNALLKFLRSGYRMERPSNCGHELYSVMLSCWKVRPKDRPTFTELKKSIDELLESVTTSKYLDLDVLTSTELASFRVPAKDSTSLILKNKNRSTEAVSNDRYVHPVLLNNSKQTSSPADMMMIY